MQTLAIKAVATGPQFYYREEHEWQFMSGDPAAHLAGALVESEKLAKSMAGKGGDLTATLSQTVDGIAQPDVVVSGLTRKDLSRFQRSAHKIAGDMLAHGEKIAARKSKS